MADLQCPICDFKVVPEADQDQVLALLGVGSVNAGETLVAHMGDHTLSDWLKAFKMADAYIAQLEGQVEAMAGETAGYRAQITQMQNELAAARTFQTNPIAVRPQDGGPHPGAGFEATSAFAPQGSQLERMFTPGEIARMQKRAANRARIEAHDSNESLIPYINPASRPEGVVGRKM